MDGKKLTLLAVVLLVYSLVPTISGAIEADFYIVDVQPYQVYPGETTVINITIKNLAPEVAAYLKATLDPDDASPIDPVGASKKYLNKAGRAQKSTEYFGLILRGDELTLSYPIYVDKDAAEDVYKTPLLLEWKNTNMQDITETLHVALYVKGEPSLRIAKIRTSPQELKKDTENNDVIVTLENAGKAAAKSVRIKAAFRGPFSEAYSNSDSDFVAEIGRDKTHAFTLSVDIDEKARPGKYTFPLTVTYRGDDREYVFTKDISLVLESEADFEVREVKSTPEPVTPGDDFRVNVLVVNVGQRDAESVKAVLKTKSFFTGVKTDYLGDIKVGESKVATFELEADRDVMPDNYENDIKIIWTEGEKRLEEIHSFGITVASRNNEGAMGRAAAALAVVLVLLIGVALGRKRR